MEAVSLFALRLCGGGFNSLQKGRAEVFEGTCDDFEPFTQCEDITPGLFKLPVFGLWGEPKADFRFGQFAMTIPANSTAVTNAELARDDMSVLQCRGAIVVSTNHANRIATFETSEMPFFAQLLGVNDIVHEVFLSCHGSTIW